MVDVKDDVPNVETPVTETPSVEPSVEPVAEPVAPVADNGGYPTETGNNLVNGQSV